MNYAEFIDRYLNGSLNEPEEKELKLLMQQETFRQELQLASEMKEALDSKSWYFIQDKQNKDYKEYQEIYASKTMQDLKKALQERAENKESRFQTKHIVSIAASIALLFGVYTSFFTGSSNSSLYQKHIAHTELILSITRSDTTNQWLEKLNNALEQKNYVQAIDILNEPSFEKPKSLNKTLFLGYCYTLSNQMTKAKEQWKQLEASDSLDASKSSWFLGLIHLKENNTEKAKEYFNKIVSTKGYKHQEAKEILGQL